jgi:hypothetical protein
MDGQRKEQWIQRKGTNLRLMSLNERSASAAEGLNPRLQITQRPAEGVASHMQIDAVPSVDGQILGSDGFKPVAA